MPELVCAADSPQWLTERRKGVTATDITAIIGLSPYESAYSLYFKKRGDIPDEHTDNDRLRLGRELEPLICDRWREANGINQTWFQGGHLYRSSVRPWQMATPDRLLGSEAVIELKSWADIDRHTWADGPPARVRAQVLWQMDTLDAVRGHVGVLFLPSGEFRSYVIEHGNCQASEASERIGGDPPCSVCTDTKLLVQAGRDFMDRLDANDPPSPDASTATLAALKARFTDIHHDKQAEIDPTLWTAFTDHREAVKSHDERARAAENEIREQAGEARTLTVNGEKVATRVVFDSQVKAHTRHSDYIRCAASKGDPE